MAGFIAGERKWPPKRGASRVAKAAEAKWRQ
jgi:hypothetical protein